MDRHRPIERAISFVWLSKIASEGRPALQRDRSVKWALGAWECLRKASMTGLLRWEIYGMRCKISCFRGLKILADLSEDLDNGQVIWFFREPMALSDNPAQRLTLFIGEIVGAGNLVRLKTDRLIKSSRHF